MIKFFQIKTVLTDCRLLQGEGDVRRLVHVLIQNGFFPGRGAAPDLVAVENIDAHLSASLMEWSSWTAKNPLSSPEYTYSFPLVVADHEQLISSFKCDFYGVEHSSVSAGGLVDFEFTDQRGELQPFAEKLLQLALVLYGCLEPAHAYVDESFASEQSIREAVKLRIKTVSWANLFSPAYVNKYGKDFLIDIPGWKKRELSDGGVFHQLTPSLIVEHGQQARKLRKDVEGYFTASGMKVRCYAPYVIAAEQDQEDSS